LTSTAQTSLKGIFHRYLRNQMREELRGDWGSVVFYRLPAIPLAWLLLQLGIPATSITLLGLALVFCLPVIAWILPLSLVLPAAAMLSILVYILDCTDGIVARESGTTSRSGAYLDFATDILHRASMLAAIGIIADRDMPGTYPTWLAAGLVSAFLATFARLNRSHLSNLRPPEPVGPSRASWATLIYRLLSGIDTLLPLLALTAWSLGMMGELLLWLLLYTAADAVIAVVENVLKLRSMDEKSAA